MSDRMQEGIARLRRIQQDNLLGGGQQHIERQHGRGKLTARERIDVLLDPGTFVEIGSCVNTTGVRMDGRRSEAPCDGAVIGTGKVEGRTVAVYASDFTVLGGSLGMQHIQKCAELISMAARNAIPMVWLLDSSGGRLGYVDVIMAGIDWYFYTISRCSGLIPQINVLMGPCIAGQAYAPTLCDFLLMSRQTANLWLAGPRQAAAVTAEKIDESVGNADYHMVHSGTCDAVGDTDEETIRQARKLLAYMPSSFRERPPRRETGDDPARRVDELAAIVPAEYEQTYDMHRVIESLVDGGETYEIKQGYATNLITCFARLNGEPVGIAACNPAGPGSILEIDSCDKYYRFIQVLDAYNIPLVCLVDTPPRVPGEEQEARGLLRHFGKILDVYLTSSIPKISVVLRECYSDAGGMIMGMAGSTGVDLCYAWPASRFAVEASTLDYRAVYGKGIEPDAYQGYLGRSREKVDVFDVARGYTARVVDEVIEPADTRIKLIEALEITRNKRMTAPRRAKMHGTPPT
jgi:acetyl-CoA carboxylase carboxyltransferase component